MNIERYKIAGGNLTSLIEGASEQQQIELAKKQLASGVEQVGFVGNNQLEMMGGEFSVNAALAYGYELGQKGSFSVSGLEVKVEYKSGNSNVSINFCVDYSIDGDVVLFKPGIGYLGRKNGGTVNQNELADLAAKYNLPAFGLIKYSLNEIFQTWTYVAETDSMTLETACGASSLAIAILQRKNRMEVIQPNNKRGLITVSCNGNDFTAQARVVKMKGQS